MNPTDWPALFKHFDRNNNGVLECCELESFLQYVGFNPTKAEIDDYMKVLSRDENKTCICFDDFYDFAITLKDPVGDIRDAFKLFDKNKDGYIDEKEMKEMFTSGHFNPNEIEDLFKLVDVNGDGKIDYNEFVELFTQTFHDEDQQCKK